MTPSPVARALELLQEAERIREENHWRTGADKILMHTKLVECLRDLRDYHGGHAETHLQLVNLVEGMLASLAAKPPNGSLPWWDEKPGPHSSFVSAIKRLHNWLKG